MIGEYNRSDAKAGESGNVLFLILIAVALFAALSYAVTQTSRSSGGDAGRETSRIGSAQVTQYPAGVRTSLIRMIIGGQDVTTLEFNAPANFANCEGAPTTFKRCVFHPNGGGATHTRAPNEVLSGADPDFAGDWIFNGANEIENIGTSEAGAGATSTPAPGSSSTADLIAFLPGVAKAVCESINSELGLPTAVANITEDSILYTSTSSMVNPNGTTDTRMPGDGASIGVTATALAGQPFGCFWDNNGNADGPASYVYYHVLIER